jgi:hypothetical protein
MLQHAYSARLKITSVLKMGSQIYQLTRLIYTLDLHMPYRLLLQLLSVLVTTWEIRDSTVMVRGFCP